MPHAKRRIAHFVPITSKEMLINVLLASAAIPIAFPPVQIGDSWYVDGGVGNNIPIREAAYFLRYINRHQSQQFRIGEVFCVMLDEPGKVSAQHRFGMMDILWRTYDVFEYVHMRPIVDAWTRINKEVDDHDIKVQDFERQLTTLNLPPQMSQEISTIVHKTLGQIGGATNRLNIPLHLIEPGGTIGDLLRFDSKVLKQHLSRGYKEATQAFLAKNFIDAAQHKILLERIFDPIA